MYLSFCENEVVKGRNSFFQLGFTRDRPPSSATRIILHKKTDSSPSSSRSGQAGLNVSALKRDAKTGTEEVRKFMQSAVSSGATPSILHKQLEGTPAANLVLYLNDDGGSEAPAAFVTAHVVPNGAATVQTIYCSPKYRNQGLEKELIAGVVKSSIKSGCSEVHIHSLTSATRQAVDECRANLPKNVTIKVSFVQTEGTDRASAFVANMAKQREPIPLLFAQPQGTPPPNLIVTIPRSGDNKKLVAFAAVHLDREKKVATVQSIYCIPSARGNKQEQKHEQDLLAEVERIAKEAACKRMNIHSRTTQMKQEMDAFCARTHSGMVINHETSIPQLLNLANFVVQAYESLSSSTPGARPFPALPPSFLPQETQDMLKQRRRERNLSKYRQICVSIGSGNCTAEKFLAEQNPLHLIVAIEPEISDPPVVDTFVQHENTDFFHGTLGEYSTEELRGRVDKVFVLFPAFELTCLERAAFLEKTFELLKPDGQLHLWSNHPPSSFDTEETVAGIKRKASRVLIERHPLSRVPDYVRASSTYAIFADPVACFEYNQLTPAALRIQGLSPDIAEQIRVHDSFTLIRAIK